MKYIFSILLVSVFISCKESNRDRIATLIKEWEGKEILFPDNMVFTEYAKDTIDFRVPEADYAVVYYVDSMGCTLCRLQFPRWKQVMYEMDSVSGKSIPFLFIFHPKNKGSLLSLKNEMIRDKFGYPVWVDMDDTFNKQNKLPQEIPFHSFLVDRQHKVVAMGDPFQNPKVRELYLKFISGNDEQSSAAQANMTTASLDNSVVDLGEFDWKTPQKAVFTLRNTGKQRLVVHDIALSCGCMSVDYPQSPVEPGETISIEVTYSAEKPEYINRALTLYANIEAPLQITVKGNAH